VSRKVVVDGVVRAAGGVVTRPGRYAEEVALVHRPRHDDWSFPKGHLHPDESDVDAARREVEEETGLRVRVGEELPTTRYVDANGRLKAVRYWRMEPVAGAHVGEPDDEVDEVRWVSTDEAATLLSYDDDRRLLETLHGPSAGGET
jgi:8-oxo-dGTP diphosphatase